LFFLFFVLVVFGCFFGLGFVLSAGCVNRSKPKQKHAKESTCKQMQANLRKQKTDFPIFVLYVSSCFSA
jgi:hypothetical protein